MDTKHRMWYLLLLAIIIGICSYYIVPSSQLDLYRYFSSMDIYQQWDFQTFLIEVQTLEDPLFQLIFYGIAKTDIYGLLSGCCTFIGYLIMFYILNDYSKKVQLKTGKFLIVLAFFILTLNYIYFASGLRSTLAMMVFVLATYLDYVKEKKGILYKSLYLVSCLLHKSLFLGVIFRILLIFDYKKIKKLFIPIIIIYFITPSITIYLAKILSNIDALWYMFSRANSYLMSSRTIFSDSISILRFGTFIFGSLIFFYNIYNKNIEENVNSKFYNMLKLIIIFTFASINYANVALRFSLLAIFMMNIVIIDFMKNVKNKQVYILFILCSTLIFIISIVGQMAPRAAINFQDLFKKEGITRNIYEIFIEGK